MEYECKKCRRLIIKGKEICITMSDDAYTNNRQMYVCKKCYNKRGDDKYFYE